MYDMVKEMPGGPEWHSHHVNLHDAPEEPQILYYRNIIECAEFLFQSPEFEGHMDFSPHHAYDENEDAIYHEMNTGEDWHEIQVCQQLSVGTAIWIDHLISSGHIRYWVYSCVHYFGLRQDPFNEL